MSVPLRRGKSFAFGIRGIMKPQIKNLILQLFRYSFIILLINVAKKKKNI